MHSAQDINITPGHALCTIERVVVLIWRQTPTRAGIEAVRGLFHLVHTRRPTEKWGFLTVFEPAATISNVPDAVRDSLSALLREWDKDIYGAGVVVDADGFRASLIRTFLATMNLSSRLEFPTSTERLLDTGVRWMAARDPHRKLDAGALGSAIVRLRSRWSPAATTPPTGYSPAQ